MEVRAVDRRSRIALRDGLSVAHRERARAVPLVQDRGSRVRRRERDRRSPRALVDGDEDPIGAHAQPDRASCLRHLVAPPGGGIQAIRHDNPLRAAAPDATTWSRNGGAKYYAARGRVRPRRERAAGIPRAPGEDNPPPRSRRCFATTTRLGCATLSFSAAHPILKAALAARSYVDPTPVQLAVLADDARDRDLLVSAQTGSGKTVAFGLVVAQT